MQSRSTFRSVLSAKFDSIAAAAHKCIFSRQGLAVAGTLALCSAASPALAAQEPTTKLVRCGAESCLQISGYRADADTLVMLNGEPVAADGEQNWQVRLPVETVRQWSAPNARTIEVSLRDPETEQETSAHARLPIGLLGDISNLAFLEVRAP